MTSIVLILSIWLIGTIVLFVCFVIDNNAVKVTDNRNGNIYFAKGLKKYMLYLLLAILWPYIIIKNVIKGG